MLKNLLENLVYNLDFFKVNMNLHFTKGRNKFSSIIGFLYSICILTVLAFYFFKSDMIQKLNPTIGTQIIPLLSPPYININDKKLNLIFGMTGVNDLSSFQIDPSIIRINIAFAQIEIKKQMKQFNPGKFHLCTQEELQNQTFINNRNNFSGYCLDSFNYDLNGWLLDSNFSTLVLQIYICDNKTSNNTCKSPEEIDSFLENKYFLLIYQDFVESLQNYENPISEFQRVETFRFSRSIATKFRVNLIKGELTQNDGIIGNSYKNLEYYTQADYKDFQTYYRNLEESSPIAEIYFLSANKLKKTSRVYEKFTDLLARLSGIANTLMAIGFFVITIYQNFSMKIYFVNKLFKFFMNDYFFSDIKSFENKPPESREKINKKSFVNINLENKSGNFEKKEYITNSKQQQIEFVYLDQKQIIDGKENNEIDNSTSQVKFEKEIELKLLLMKKSRRFTIFNYLFSIFKKTFGMNLTRQEKFLFIAEGELQNIFDVKQVLRRIKISENFVNIFLDDKQKNFLNSYYFFKERQVMRKKSYKKEKIINFIKHLEELNLSNIDLKIKNSYKSMLDTYIELIN